MDIKFFLIIAIMLLVIMYVVNEFKLLKSYIVESNETNIKLFKSKYNSIVNDIREINADLINQTKKINKIHSQKITTMSNYFTESETDGNNLLNYLSDSKSKHKNIITSATSDNNFKINFNTSVGNVEQKDNKYNKNDEIAEIDNHSKHSNKSGKSYDKNIKTNDVDLISVSDICDVDEQNNKIKDIDVIDNNLDIIDILNVNVNDNTKNDTGRPVCENDNNSNGSRQSESHKCESQVPIDTNEKNNEKSSFAGENNIKEINQDKEDKSIDRISIKSLDVKSYHDAISFGSKKKGKNIIVGTNKTDVESIVTNDILKINQLNSIDSYNLKQLQKIATILTIPIKYKDGKKNITYKKEELYLKIKEEINKKSI